MTIQKEAISLEDFRRKEKGLPPKPKQKRKIVELTPPVVSDQITYADIPETEIFEFSARRRVEKNKDSVHFTGYSTYIEFRDKTFVSGWLDEGNFQKLRLRIQAERPDLLNKIGL